MNKKHILIIEDEENISTSLSIILKSQNFDVTVCDTGKKGLQEYLKADLLVLDLMLPDMNGLDILKKIRETSSTFPILIVSAKNTEQDLVNGLLLGADDYITKPFSIQELILRIKRTIDRIHLFEKKTKVEKTIKEFSFGINNHINFETLTANTRNGTISLTRQEADMIIYMIEHKSKIISRNELIKHIWGHNDDYESRTVDNFIVRFRKYFEENPKRPTHFITKRGAGYIFKI